MVISPARLIFTFPNMTPAFFAGVIQGASLAHRYLIWHYVTLCDAIAKTPLDLNILHTTMTDMLGNQNCCQVMRINYPSEGNYPKLKVSRITNIYHAEKFRFGDISVITFHLKFLLFTSVENIF